MSNAIDLGYKSNKSVQFKKINSIHISHFRSISNRDLILGDNFTLITGKNGTMKSTILGLIAHPFSSPTDARDMFGDILKTELNQVFNLSMDKDIEKYEYDLVFTTTKNETLTETVRVFPNKKESRHRIVVGKTNKAGLGNFALNTCYLNFKRLYPMVETNAKEASIQLNPSEDDFIADAYFHILGSTAFSNHCAVIEKTVKETLGPKDCFYDFSSISSGEDNIGNIIVKLIAFKSNSSKGSELQGILCIDEIEAGLHPVAQENLFDFLVRFSKKYKVQIVATTHSVSLIQYAINKQMNLGKDSISINMISTAFAKDRNFTIIRNPSYNDAYKELTLRDISLLEDSYKIKVVVEDNVAKFFLNQLFFGNRKVKNKIAFVTNLLDNGTDGNGFRCMKSLIKNGEFYLNDSIVIFDADVPLNDLSRSKVCFTKFPDPLNLPLEKRIIKYIYEKDNDDPFFIAQNKEKNAFINEFSNCGITPSILKNENIFNAPIDYFKNWSNRNDKLFKLAFKEYLQNNKSYFEPFKNTIIKFINKKLEQNCLPLIE